MRGQETRAQPVTSHTLQSRDQSPRSSAIIRLRDNQQANELQASKWVVHWAAGESFGTALLERLKLRAVQVGQYMAVVDRLFANSIS